MTNKFAPRKPPTASDGIESLYLDLLHSFYDAGDRKKAEKIATRLGAALATRPDFSDSIRAEEIRSLIAELRGDLAAAIRSREAEIRKILELHSLAINTPSWPRVIKLYDFSDISDRLDLLAILYDGSGDLDRAISTLRESKQFCEAHMIPFDGQELLDELERSRQSASVNDGDADAIGKSQATKKRSLARRRRAAAGGAPERRQ
ncbi:MAG TPA: hypothetical protein VNH11_34345 [Pirellulales bacterium]|nr:hypothetical protein [Pirellulales bacterium]